MRMTPVSLTWVRRKARWLPRRWPSSSEPPWSLTNRRFVAGLTCQPSRSPAPRASGSPTKGAVICSWGASRQPLLRGVLCDGSAWLHGLFALFQRTADGHETWTLTCYCSRTANCPARHQSPRVAHGSSRNPRTPEPKPMATRTGKPRRVVTPLRRKRAALRRRAATSCKRRDSMGRSC